MTLPSTWRELWRTDDRREAMNAITTIAAMEFDVRCRDRSGQPVDLCDPDAEHAPPYRVDVPGTHWDDLADVVDVMLDEQSEFDRLVEARARHRRWTLAVILIVFALIPVVVAVIAATDDDS